jgi:hypothetical protein
MRFYTDFYFANGQESEVQRSRLADFKAALAALDSRHGPTVCAVVLEGLSVHKAADAAGHKNRSAGSAVTLERLNVGLRKLAVHYRLMGG